MTIAVTPTLFVGDEPMSFPTTFCDTPCVAEAAIRAGISVRVANLEIAKLTLRLLGVDEQMIEERIHFATTGQVLHAV